MKKECGDTSAGSRSPIPLIRPNVGKEELEQVKSVLESGWLSQGPKVKEFERAICRRVGSAHALATTSCTTALSLALQACRIQSGSEVIVPDFTFPATGNVVTLHGSVPVIVDVDLETMAIKADDLGRAIGKRTRAVIVVHPFGHPADMGPIREISEKKGIVVIEDAATAFGTKYKGVPIGSRGSAVCFSFHPRKLLTTGEGGALLTESDDVWERAKLLRNHGETDGVDRVRFKLPGYNYRMSDIQAAIGLAQIRKFEGLVKERRKQARVYSELLRDTALDIITPEEKEWAFSTFQSYVVRLGPDFGVSRDRCIRVMRRRFAIETQIGTYSLHLERSFANAVFAGKLENGEELMRTTLTLPLYQGLSVEDQQRVVNAIEEVSKGG